MLNEEYIHEDLIRRVVTAMLTNELYGTQKSDGKFVDSKYISSFANRLIKNLKS